MRLGVPVLRPGRNAQGIPALQRPVRRARRSLIMASAGPVGRQPQCRLGRTVVDSDFLHVTGQQPLPYPLRIQPRESRHPLGERSRSDVNRSLSLSMCCSTSGAAPTSERTGRG